MCYAKCLVAGDEQNKPTPVSMEQKPFIHSREQDRVRVGAHWLSLIPSSMCYCSAWIRGSLETSQGRGCFLEGDTSIL